MTKRTELLSRLRYAWNRTGKDMSRTVIGEAIDALAVAWNTEGASQEARAEEILRQHGNGLPWERGKGRDTWAAALAAVNEALSISVSRTDVLRAWFGEDLYARDHEYLDATYGRQAEAVLRLLAAAPNAKNDDCPRGGEHTWTESKPIRCTKCGVDWVWLLG